VCKKTSETSVGQSLLGGGEVFKILLMRASSLSKDNALMACRVQFICLHMPTIHVQKHCMIHLQNRLSNQFHVDLKCRLFDMSFEMDLQVRGFAYLGIKFEPIVR
jgi:hypothetical protein